MALSAPSASRILWGVAFGLLAIFLANNVGAVNRIVAPRS
jgi:hypothetical protein